MNGYNSQLEFDTEVLQLTQAANDGHLSLSLCSLGIFQFNTQIPLVSLSSDGIQIPQLYTLRKYFSV
jgi:hypothetical protein